jgi:flagellum-specific peptidoglycan hydrolase FlgJ
VVVTLNVGRGKIARALPNGNTLNVQPNADTVNVQEWIGQDGLGERISDEYLSYDEYDKYRRENPDLDLPEYHPPKIRKPGTNANGNTIGAVVGETPSAKVQAAQANPPVQAETPKEEGWWGSWGSSVVHTVLDVGGAIPVVGIFSDGLNAGIYAAEGDMANAAISGVSAAANLIPGGGAATKAGKLAYKGGKMALEKAEKELAEKLLKERLEKEAAERLAKEKLEKEAARKTEAGGGGGSKKKDSQVKKGKKPKCGGRATYGKQAGDFLGNEMERDHIPNVASLKDMAEKMLLEDGIDLTPAQRDSLFGKVGKNGQREGGKIYTHAQTVAVPKEIHRASPTTGNHENYKDSKDLAGAARRDTKNHRDAIEKSDNHKDCAKALEEASKVIDKISNDQYKKFLNSLIDDALEGKRTTNPWKGIL